MITDDNFSDDCVSRNNVDTFRVDRDRESGRCAGNCSPAFPEFEYFEEIGGRGFSINLIFKWHIFKNLIWIREYHQYDSKLSCHTVKKFRNYYLLFVSSPPKSQVLYIFHWLKVSWCLLIHLDHLLVKQIPLLLHCTIQWKLNVE